MPALLVGGLLLVLIGGLGFARTEPRRRSPGPANLRKTDAPRRRRGDGPADRGRVHRVSRPLRRERPEEDGRHRQGRPGDDRVSSRHPHRVLRDHRSQGRIRADPLRLATTRGTRWPCRYRKTCTSSRARPSAESSRTRPGTRSREPRSTSWGLRPSASSANRVFSIGTAETDARGRWSLDVAPKDLRDVSVHATHPHYIRRPGESAWRVLDGAIVLTRGLAVTGRVVDAGGRPVKGARVQLGDNFGVSVPVGTTDDRGAFTLENCDAGATTVTVQAEGYAPRIQDMQVEGQAEPAVVRLSEPAATLRGRIVDVEGEPVAGAVIGADTWRKRRSRSIPGHHRRGRPVRMARRAP